MFIFYGKFVQFLIGQMWPLKRYIYKRRTFFFASSHRKPDPIYRPGGIVLVAQNISQKGKTKKFLPEFVGPYQMGKRVSQTCYLVKDIPVYWKERIYREFNVKFGDSIQGWDGLATGRILEQWWRRRWPDFEKATDFGGNMSMPIFQNFRWRTKFKSSKALPISSTNLFASAKKEKTTSSNGGTIPSNFKKMSSWLG